MSKGAYVERITGLEWYDEVVPRALDDVEIAKKIAESRTRLNERNIPTLLQDEIIKDYENDLRRIPIGLCPKCGAPGLLRRLDDRQTTPNELRGRGSWFNYKCRACQHFFDRIEEPN